jgi:diacylglycerol kinase (ATP)
MGEIKKVFFIINKYSGTGFRPEIEGRIIDRCSELGYECTIEFTQSRGHATELAQQAVKENFKIAFAMGGDGTVNEVARGLVHTDTAMGILPKGSGNGLARHLKIPLSFKHALELLGRHQVISMDTFTVNDHLSVNVSGIGFDGHIAGLFGKNGKRGLIGYIKLVVKEFASFKEFPINLVIDGEAFHSKAFIVAFANASQFGNNARVAPAASVCDQKLDISFIKKVPFIHAIGFGAKMFSGNLDKSSFVEMKTGKKMNIEFSEPMPYHIDGEPLIPAASFNIAIQPASLRMLTPLGSSGF